MLLQRSKEDKCCRFPALAIPPQPAERWKKCNCSIPRSLGLEQEEDAASSDLQQRQREAVLGDGSYNTARGAFTEMIPG